MKQLTIKALFWEWRWRLHYYGLLALAIYWLGRQRPRRRPSAARYQSHLRRHAAAKPDDSPGWRAPMW